MEIHQLNYKSSPLFSLMCADDLIIFSQSAADLVNVDYFRKLNRERQLTINLNKTKKKMSLQCTYMYEGAFALKRRCYTCNMSINFTTLFSSFDTYVGSIADYGCEVVPQI